MSDIISDTSTDAMVDEFKKRGVEFPIGGFAPGRYNVVCRSCARRFDGDKRAHQCLPCAVVKTIAAAGENNDHYKEGRRDGYRQAVADLLDRGRQRFGEAGASETGGASAGKA
ncbi:hypothetical protein H9Q09_12085 [Aurantimonas sp. DM33-3]|uniref:hypothetical protein n=1 Tax=Aurantimonas sp. DM33-3 TaxID=2766955 RepID=UPI001651F477|nr:hypothetical protein [Aurantimonas sp. DM33-3]MBC6716948.1 hypothetical protein [Aurantimonas sp. DM33-3]